MPSHGATVWTVALPSLASWARQYAGALASHLKSPACAHPLPPPTCSAKTVADKSHRKEFPETPPLAPPAALPKFQMSGDKTKPPQSPPTDVAEPILPR